MAKKDHIQNHQGDDAKVYGVVAAFITALGSLILLMRISEWIEYRKTIFDLLWTRALRYAAPGLALFAAVAAIAFYCCRRKKHVWWFGYGAVVFALWSAASFSIALYGLDAIRIFYAIFPAAAVLYAIVSLYAADFAWVSVVTGAGLLYCRIFPVLYGRSSDKTLREAASVVLAALALLALATFITWRRRGTVKTDLYFPPLYAVCSLLTAVPVLSLVWGATVAQYGLFAFIVCFFVSAVIYTVRLM